jgi:predicted dehydrogenase
MDTVRIGIVGLGMGASHAKRIVSGQAGPLTLAAVAARSAESRAKFPEVPGFATAEALFTSGLVDAVLIATPHPSHVALGIAALRAGLHVLMEKPLAVHTAEAEQLLAAHEDKRRVFAMMFNQRTDPYHLKIRAWLQSGQLGELRRVQWTITDWFRTEAYYASGSWRATWRGEGGGVLLNQAPHQLDLFQWLFGQPVRVRAHAGFGRYHAIEVEDDVTAYMEFASGATGLFVTSTGESPGTNRLEIAGERGRVFYENDRLVFIRNVTAMTDFSRTATEGFSRPPTTEEVFTAPDHGGQHAAILANFGEAILRGTPLIAPAAEGLASLALANAMLLSAWTGETISLPLDAQRYAAALQAKIAASSLSPRPPRD